MITGQMGVYTDVLFCEKLLIWGGILRCFLGKKGSLCHFSFDSSCGFEPQTLV